MFEMLHQLPWYYGLVSALGLTVVALWVYRVYGSSGTLGVIAIAILPFTIGVMVHSTTRTPDVITSLVVVGLFFAGMNAARKGRTHDDVMHMLALACTWLLKPLLWGLGNIVGWLGDSSELPNWVWLLGLAIVMVVVFTLWWRSRYDDDGAYADEEQPGGVAELQSQVGR